MNNLIYYVLQATASSAILYSYYHFFLRNKQFHQYNRFYLLSITVISLLIPFLNIPVYFTEQEKESSILLQTLTVLAPEPAATEQLIQVPVAGTSPGGTLTALELMYYSYAFFVLLFLTRVIISLLKIRKMRLGYPVEKLDNIYFINTVEPGTPFSFFSWLFWNKEIELRSEKGEQIFRHELFHIRQKHSIDILFMELVTVVLWINPFFHIIKKETRAIHEFLADRFAANETEKWAYAELLLMQALNTRHALVNPFFHNQIKRRIAMITSSQQPRHRYFRKVLVLPLMLTVTALFAFTFKNKKDDVTITKSAKKFTIVVDAGHGGSDKGVQSPDGKYTEAQLTLAIAKKIQSLASEYNIGVVMTRDGDQYPGNVKDRNAALQKRLAIANLATPGAFLSIHINSSADVSKYQENFTGIEAYISAKKKDETGELLASAILQQLSGIYNTSLQVRQRQEEGIYVLDQNSHPSVLLQCGYIDNADDMSFISSTSNQEKLARGILEALARFSNKSNESVVAAEVPIPPMPDIPFADTPKRKLKALAGLNLNVDEIIMPEKNVDQTAPGLYIINNKAYTREEINKLYRGMIIEARQVIVTEAGNKEAIAKYGPIARNGVIEFVGAKDQVTHNIQRMLADSLPNVKENPLIVIDGVIQPADTDPLKKIDPNSIQSITVLKGSAAIDIYGSKGKNGVIVLILKHKSNGEESELAEKTIPKTSAEDGLQEDTKVFEKIDTGPSFPGGIQSWQSFLKKNLRAHVPIKNNAPIGEWTAWVQFIVLKDGTVTDIKPLSKHGYGMEEELVRIMKLSPKWIPGIQSGQAVKAYHKVQVTFVVDAETNNSTLREVVMVSYNSDKAPASIATGNNPMPLTTPGSSAWRRFFERNLNPNVALGEGWKAGAYNLYFKFTVDNNGAIADVRPLSYQNSAVARHCIDLFKKIKQVVPAQQLKPYYIQPLTFIIEESIAKPSRIELPVENGNITTFYGAYAIGNTNLTGDNPGITISTAKGSRARSMQHGIVVAIHTIGKNKAITIGEDDYFTTYSGLGNIRVTKGETVKKGDILGEVTDTDDNNSYVIDFIVMHKNKTIDPIGWLKTVAY